MLQKLRCTCARSKFSKILTLGGRQLTSVRRPTDTVCHSLSDRHIKIRQCPPGAWATCSWPVPVPPASSAASSTSCGSGASHGSCGGSCGLSGCATPYHRSCRGAVEASQLIWKSTAQHSTARGGYQTMSEPRNNWETTRLMFGKLNCLVNRIFHVW